MTDSATPSGNSRFCSDCGTALNVGAKFCHSCGAAVHGGSGTGPSVQNARAATGMPAFVRWGVPTVAVVALVVLTAMQFGERGASVDNTMVPLGSRTMAAPDISSMSPEERADRLFNRVMRLSSEGKTDSAAFFGPMALGAIEALAPLDAHRRYDLGLVALVMGDAGQGAAQADTILRQHPTHLLGLSLAARAADARGNASAAREFRRRLLAAEPAERTRGLLEYTDHAADITAALTAARER